MHNEHGCQPLVAVTGCCDGRAATRSTIMSRHPLRQELPRAQFITERIFSTLDRFLHIEALSGIALIIAAVAAMIWANSPAAGSYQAFWHAPLSIGFGDYILSKPLHFWINDALMTIFFLVIGIEIRREI